MKKAGGRESARERGGGPGYRAGMVGRTLTRISETGGQDSDAGVANLSFLVDADPQLAAALTPDQRRVAREHVLVKVLDVPRGARWEPPALARSALALIVIEGALVREVTLGDQVAADVLGPGTLIPPGRTAATAVPASEGAIRWSALGWTRLAVVEHGSVPNPALRRVILEALLARAIRQCEAAAFWEATRARPRAEDRLLLVLAELARSCGRAVPEGIVVDLALTHALLGRLVGCHRATAAAALSQLDRAGLVRRRRPSGWLLSRAALATAQRLVGG